MKLRLLLFAYFFAGIFSGLSAQKVTNELQGYFKAVSDSTLYDYFSFDGNGTVDIVGLGTGYYFQKDDTLIVYPDKSIFKFIVKDDQLYGASDWVEGNIWKKVKDTAVTNTRLNAAESDGRAMLLYKYYQLKSSVDEWAFLGEPDTSYENSLRGLCDSGLSKACLDVAGLKILEDIGGAGSLLSAKKEETEEPEPNEEILNIIYKAIEFGDLNGYSVLGGYYALIGDMTMAKEMLTVGSDLGCSKCSMALFSLALEEEAQKQEAEK
ncbi:MAG: hypothetical protein QM594_17230 [Niabella sp.]